MNAIDVVKWLETHFPKELAYDWDNVGLQVGSLNRRCQTVLVTLDVTKEVVEEAVALKAELVISHHPLIFKPIYNVATESPRGRVIAQLIQHKIALYSAHTNYDLAEGGMNDELAAALGLRDVGLLDETDRIGRYGTIDPTSLEDFIAFVQRILNIREARYIGRSGIQIRTVGISGGSGSNHVGAAQRKNCDLYLTGDVTYHTALDCRQMGQNVLDIGHYAETIFKSAVARRLREAFPELDVRESEIDTDPYRRV
jgi:dinuclear metal center YbgI/SA1388 family protein